jgi:hypothetical protein
MFPDTTTSVLIADRDGSLFEGTRGLLETTFDRVYLVNGNASLMEDATRLQPNVYEGKSQGRAVMSPNGECLGSHVEIR